MKTPQDTRRNFLFQTASGFGSAWIALPRPAVLRAHEHRCKAVADPNARFEFFSPTEAAEIDALSAQIIPSDDGSAGARQAGVIFFIDNALVTFDRERQALYKDGLATLQSRTQEMFPDVTAFSKLESEQQIQLLIAIEKTDFFETVRVHTIMG